MCVPLRVAQVGVCGVRAKLPVTVSSVGAVPELQWVGWGRLFTLCPSGLFSSFSQTKLDSPR
eukprot:4599088-Prymnesium_polylepis.1